MGRRIGHRTPLDSDLIGHRFFITFNSDRRIAPWALPNVTFVRARLSQLSCSATTANFTPRACRTELMVSKRGCAPALSVLYRLSLPSPESLAGGPLKPDFGLSGAVRRLGRVFPPLVRVFVPSIPTRSLRVLQRRLRSGGSCSTASPPDARITLA